MGAERFSTEAMEINDGKASLPGWMSYKGIRKHPGESGTVSWWLGRFLRDKSHTGSEKQNPKDTKDKVVIAGRVTLEILEVVFLHEILTYLEHFKNNPAKDSQRRGRNHIIPSEVRENGIDYFILFIKIFKIYISIF